MYRFLFEIAVEDLKGCMEWLNGCLVTRTLFLPANRLKVWASYQESLLRNINSMTTVTKSRQAAAVLALQLMKELVALNYPEPVAAQATSPISISDIEEDIVAYISGYMLKKFAHCVEAQSLMADKPTGLTALMNRGGLTQAKEDFISVVRELELVFRQMPQKSVDLAAFESGVCAQNIPSHFFNLLECVDSSAENKETFFKNIMCLYFTARAHQQCRYLVEKRIRSTKKSLKSKALRDSF